MGRSRIEQREELMIALHELVLPLKHVVESDHPRVHQRSAIVRHDFNRDAQDYLADLREYCRMGDRVFEWECNNLEGRLYQLLDCLQLLGLPNNIPTAKERLAHILNLFKKELRDLPCEDPATVIPPASPFSASRRIRAICGEAQTRIDLFDPWLSAEVFYRYLPVISRAVAFTVVTEPVSASDTNKKNRERWEGVKAVAPMVESEYPKFQLLVLGSLHDRWLRVDDTAYHLGGSVKDAGKNDPYTISTLDQHLYPRLDELIGRAMPWK